MNSLWKGLRKPLLILAMLGCGLLVITTAGIVWLFYLSTQTEKPKITCNDAISYVQQAAHAAEPVEELQNLHAAVNAYLSASDIKQADAIQRISELLPRMQKLRQDNRLAPEYLNLLLDEPATLSAFVQSGLFDFSARLDENGRHDSADLLCEMMKIVARERHGERVDALKPLIVHLLQQGTRPDWVDWNAVYMPPPTDPVLVAVYTRDAGFLKAVLATGFPAKGEKGDSRPEDEARWQNSPELVDILQATSGPDLL